MIDMGVDIDTLDQSYYTPLTNAISQFAQQPENLTYIGKYQHVVGVVRDNSRSTHITGFWETMEIAVHVVGFVHAFFQIMIIQNNNNDFLRYILTLALNFMKLIGRAEAQNEVKVIAVQDVEFAHCLSRSTSVDSRKIAHALHTRCGQWSLAHIMIF